MKRFYTIIVLLLLVVVVVAPACKEKLKVGNTISLGGHYWRILDIKEKHALVVAEQILEKREYHEFFEDITWAECSLHDYLNGDFLNTTFSGLERDRIAEDRITTLHNPWYGTSGGNETTNKIFLLSIEEVVYYFGDNGNLADHKAWSLDWGENDELVFTENIEGRFINDEYNVARLAKDADGDANWWWLRSPGIDQCNAVYVNGSGRIDVGGSNVDGETGGVRPAMWVKIAE